MKDPRRDQPDALERALTALHRQDAPPGFADRWRAAVRREAPSRQPKRRPLRLWRVALPGAAALALAAVLAVSVRPDPGLRLQADTLTGTAPQAVRAGGERSALSGEADMPPSDSASVSPALFALESAALEPAAASRAKASDAADSPEAAEAAKAPAEAAQAPLPVSEPAARVALAAALGILAWLGVRACRRRGKKPPSNPQTEA